MSDIETSNDIDDEEDDPVIALEFWNDEGDIVVAHFASDGRSDTRVADGTTSSTLLELKGRPFAQVSVVLHELGLYQRIGEIQSHDASIQALVTEFLSDPVNTYRALREIVQSAREATSRTLN